MQTIHQLPPELVQKIAAGEVIERPVYAIKELIENALDAHATFIEIELENAGLKLISITDNGIGMSHDDLNLCYLPNATSKIFELTDLHSVATFGFRGEALSSIAAISDLSIYSRQKNSNSGFFMNVIHGKLVDSGHIGMQEGTRVVVENLFENVPARKKFIQDEKKEFQLISKLILEMALSHPSVGFSLKHNKRAILFVAKNETVKKRVSNLLHSETTTECASIQYDDGTIKLSGYISKPQFATNKQFIFVNNRLIQDRSIVTAIKDAYGALLKPREYPFVLLFIALPFEKVDVNIHPRKEQIAFYNKDTVLSTIHDAVIESLRQTHLTYTDKRWKGSEGIVQESASEYIKTSLPTDIPGLQIGMTSFEDLYILQLNKTFLVKSTKDGFLLVDQHAAHERILYEQFIAAFKKSQLQTDQYLLPNPQLLHFAVDDAVILENNLDYISSLGFDIEPFGGTTFKLSAVPRIFKKHDFHHFIQECINDIRTLHKVKSIDTLSDTIITFAACKNAIKSGDELTQEQRKELLVQLDQTPNNYTCPHGRPTTVQISFEYLQKMFKRR